MERNESEIILNVGKRFFNSVQKVWRQQNIRANHRHTEHKISPALFSLFFWLTNPSQVENALRLDKPIMAAGHFEKLTSFQRGSHVVYQLPLPDKYRQTVRMKELTPGSIGLGYDATEYSFEFDETHPHTVLFGSTGSGKTVSLAGIAHSLFRTHEPDQLKAVVCDPLGKFPYMRNLSHLITQPARTDDEIESVLNWTIGEFEQRRANGLSDDKIPYRLVVMIDELSECLKDKTGWQKFTQLAAKGRQFGINLIGDIQTTEKDVSMSYFENVTNRYLGFISSQRTATQLAGVTGVQATNSVGKGDFFHVRGINKNRLQFAWIDARDFADLPTAELKPVQTVDTNAALESLENIPEPLTGRPKIEHGLSDLAVSYNFAIVHKRLMSFSEIERVLNLGRRPAERLRQDTLEFLAADVEIKRDYLNSLAAIG